MARAGESETTTTAQQTIAEAKERVDAAVREFVQAQQLGGGHQAVASSNLHTAVLTLYWKLRVHLYHESDAWGDLRGYDEVEKDHIWTGTHPQVDGVVEISGLSDLDAWMEKEVEVSAGAAGPTSTTEQSFTTTIALPAGAAIEAAKILLLEYEQFSLGIDVSVEQQTKIDEDLMDEVREWRRQNV